MNKSFLFLCCTLTGCTLERDDFNEQMKELTCEKYETCETAAHELLGFTNFNECFAMLSEIEEENKNDDCVFNSSNAKACLEQFRAQECPDFATDGFPTVCTILYDCEEQSEEFEEQSEEFEEESTEE